MIETIPFTDLSLSAALLAFMWYWFNRLDRKVEQFERRLRHVEDKLNVYSIVSENLNTPTN